MKEDQTKVFLDSSTYVTKVNGKTVMVRNRHQLLSEKEEKFSDICAGLLQGFLSKYIRQKMKNYSQIPGDKSASARIPTNVPFQGLQPLPLFNPNSNLVGSASGPSTLGPMAPQPGFYRFGDRQMALLPLTSQGSPALLPHMDNPYPQQPWMFPLPSNTMGFNFPPTGTDPGRFITDQVAGEAASVTPVSVTKHVCAECGRLRSRKFHHENPLKAGETPIPAFCKKCQKDVTSTEESDSSIKTTEKQHKRPIGGTRVSIENKDDVDSSKDSTGSFQNRRRSKVKVKKLRGVASEDCLSKEELREKTIVRHMSNSPDNDSGIAVRKQHASPVHQFSSSYSRSTNSSRGNTERKQRREVAKNSSRSSHETQQLSPEQVVATTAEISRHIPQADTASRYETSNTDSASMKSWRNESPVSSEMMSNHVSGFEDPAIILSRAGSESSSRRRRLERSSDYRENIESSRRTRLSMDDKIEVATEHNTYKTRRLPPSKEYLENQKEGIDEKASDETRNSRQQLTIDVDALNYYRNDWARVSEQNEGAQRRLRPKDLEKLDLGAEYQPSKINASSLYWVARDDIEHLSRARNLPRQLNEKGRKKSQQKLSLHNARYLPSGSGDSPDIQKEAYTRIGHQNLANEEDIHPYEKPYVRDATDRGTEVFLEPSPKQHHKRHSNPEVNASELTEEIERVDRHVTFLDLDRYEEGYSVASDENLSTRALVEERR